MQIIQVGDGPILLPQGELITISVEYEPKKFLLGLDEPRYYIFNGDELLQIDDPCVHNKICS